MWLRRWEPAAMVALCCLTVSLMSVDVLSNVESILHHASAHGGPFSCHCAAAPEVCGDPVDDGLLAMGLKR
eukprot:scaffold281637_cov55-Prasinocladus_malaysianus.AAC.1